MDFKIIEQAKKELATNGTLGLPMRKKLWLELGEIKDESGFAEKPRD